MLKKLKSLLADDTVYLTGVVLLVGVVSFGFGRLSVSERTPTEPQAAAVSLISSTSSPQVLLSATSTPDVRPPLVTVPQSAAAGFVASKTSTKYHKITCPGAKSIKASNKIYFQSETEAESAGYTKAANCKW